MRTGISAGAGRRASVGLLIKAAVLITAMSVLTASAAEACKPIPPKKWRGDFTAGIGGFVTSSTFERGGCTWNGMEAMNGFDSWVFDIDGYQKLAIRVTPDASGSVSGYFLNEACERSGFFGPALSDDPALVAIPALARWMVVGPSSGALASTVTVKAKGKQCPKKKKKKRRRRRS